MLGAIARPAAFVTTRSNDRTIPDQLATACEFAAADTSASPHEITARTWERGSK